MDGTQRHVSRFIALADVGNVDKKKRVCGGIWSPIVI